MNKMEMTIFIIGKMMGYVESGKTYKKFEFPFNKNYALEYSSTYGELQLVRINGGEGGKNLVLLEMSCSGLPTKTSAEFILTAIKRHDELQS